jgi:nucleotide-binding universal stress UspA family protein
MYKKILVPLDGSPLAEGVLPHALALANAEGAEIVILRVAADPAAEFAFSDPSLASDMVKDLEADTTKYMSEITSKLKSQGAKISAITREGAIAETILAVADEVGADVIAMSTHGRSGMRRWLMGSIADRVVNHSHIPVMLIRPQSKS